MTLTSAEAAKVRGFARNGSGGLLPSAPFTGISLGGLFELVCSWHHEYSQSAAKTILADFGRRFPLFALGRQQIENAAAGRSVFSPQVIDERNIQIFGLRRTEDYTGNSWSAFMMAFRRHLIAAGFERDFAFALSKVFAELAQNVPDHSAADVSRQSVALVGFHIRAGEADFGVADVGRGMLESLHTSPKWAGLKTSIDAVEAVVHRHATRKAGHMEGGGFKETLQAFVDHNCELRVSTGTANAVVGQTSQGRQLSATAVTDLPGVRVIGTCFLRHKPCEKKV